MLSRDAAWGGWIEQARTTQERRRPFVMEGDGCKKLFHQANRGAISTAAFEQSGIKPHSRIFFGAELNDRAPRLLFDIRDKASSTGADDVEPACAANLVAARPVVHGGLGAKDIDFKVSWLAVV
jgi:hypothetical protein